MVRHLLVLLLVGIPVHRAHAQSDPPPQPPPPTTTVDATKGGLTISSGVNSLTIGARMQFRWTLDDREAFTADTAGAGLGREDGPFRQFDVPRMRMTFSGGAFTPWLRYLFQFDFSRTSGEGGSRIKDALVEIRPVGRTYRVVAGQFKAPFGLQQITSSGRLQFVDRAITDAKFNPGRDMGVLVGGTVARTLGYEVGLFNGSGESIRQSTRAHLWAARAFLQPLGAYALSEGGSDAGAKPVLHVAVAARGGKQIRGRTAAGVVEDADDQRAFGAEFAFKSLRFYSTAEYFWMTDQQQIPVSARDIASRGFHAQAGYMVVPKKIELGVLHARIDGDTQVDHAEITELRGVFGYYWHAHGLKVQADAGQLGYGANYRALSPRALQGLPSLGARLTRGRSLTDTQMRVQLQVAF